MLAIFQLSGSFLDTANVLDVFWKSYVRSIYVLCQFMKVYESDILRIK